MKNYRVISKIVPSHHSEAAPGFKVKRTLPNYEFDYIDPFLMLDHFGPTPLKPGEARGVEEHPHRGFETVTFMFDGQIEHRDSNGNFGLLQGGGIQWMTAGSGVIHSELPPADFKEKGGTIHGVQLWINLPAKLKMTAPKYQDRTVDEIPVVRLNDDAVRVRIVAGEFHGVKSTTQSHTPITMYHIEMKENQSLEFDIPETFNSFVQITEGEGLFGETEEKIKFSEMGVFKRLGSVVKVRSTDKPVKFLFISGEPINEPVVSYGPFVMTSQKEIFEAVYDYQTGKMGSIPAEFVKA